MYLRTHIGTVSIFSGRYFGFDGIIDMMIYTQELHSLSVATYLVAEARFDFSSHHAEE
jgi:hypothetical protein